MGNWQVGVENLPHPAMISWMSERRNELKSAFTFCLVEQCFWKFYKKNFSSLIFFCIGKYKCEKILEWIASSVCSSLSSKSLFIIHVIYCSKFCYFESVREWQRKFVCVLFRCKYRVLCQEKWNEAFIVRLTDYLN